MPAPPPFTWLGGGIHPEVVLGVLVLAGVVTITVIFLSWALGGFGALGHEYATALGFTLVAVGTQVVLGSFFIGLLTMRTTEASRATIVAAAVVDEVPVRSVHG